MNIKGQMKDKEGKETNVLSSDADLFIGLESVRLQVPSARETTASVILKLPVHFASDEPRVQLGEMDVWDSFSGNNTFHCAQLHACRLSGNYVLGQRAD